VFITNEEIPHQKITGYTNIINIIKVLQFVCTKLSVNWKNKCIKIVKHFKNSKGIKMLQLFKMFYSKCEVLWRKSLFFKFFYPFRISVYIVKMKLRQQK